MKRKALKLLSMMLTAIMVFSCSLMIAFANELPEDKKLPELKTALTDSIILLTEDGYEYAIRSKDDNGADIWLWASKEQYQAEEHTVTFSKLAADTEYTFARRALDTDEVLDSDIQAYKTIAAEPPKETDAPEQTNAPKETDAPEQTESPKETDAPEQTESPKETDAPEQTESPKETDAPEQTESPKETDAPEQTESPKETDAPEQNEPLNETDAPEQTESPKETDAPEQTESPKETDAPEQNEPPKTPEKAPTPQAPVLVTLTDTAITAALPENADKNYTYEYTIDSKIFTSEPVFKELTPDTDYEIKIRIKAGTYGDKEYAQSDFSKPLKVHTLKSAAAAPAAPVLESRTETSLKVKAEANQEYSLKGSDKWQSSGEFSGLTPNTAYEIVTRVVYDSKVSMESLISEPLKAKTFIAFSGTVNGIENGKTYDAGTYFSIEATSSNLNIASPSIGDSRYRPLRWNWGGKSEGIFKDNAYKTDFTITDAGTYKLNVIFGLESYTDKGWVSENKEATLSVSFKVIAKEFTIKATSTAGGKLSPTGTLTVLQAKNYTIKMIPDKDYKLVKVLVDGKEVSAKDLKYTFEKVNANHTIHAVFEKIGKLDSPKTGDESPLLLFGIIAGVSLIAVVAIVLIIRRRTKE